MDGIGGLFRAANSIYITDGLWGLLKRGLSFLLYRLFEYSTYYIYAKPVPPGDEFSDAYSTIESDSIIQKVVSSNEEADGLELQGFEFRSHVLSARRRLDQGALATCVFVGRELGHIGWIAMNQQALDSLNEPPYRVDFDNGEAVRTGAWTNPKYRHMGAFHKYARSMARRVLQEKGFTVRRYAIRKNRVGLIKRGITASDPCGEGRYFKILWWKSWRERPFVQKEGEGQCAEQRP